MNDINSSLRKWRLSKLDAGHKFEQLSGLIRADIPGCLHLPDSPNKRFVAPGTAEKLLDRSHLTGLCEDVFGSLRTSKFVDLVEAFKLQPLILALIQLPWDRKVLEDLETYYSQFAEREDLPVEARIPLSPSVAQEIFGTSRGQALLDNQFCYNPAVLKVNQDIRDLPGPVRLPIIWDIILGEGHDGKVWKARIPEGGWRKSDGTIRTGNKWIAIKVFSNEEYFNQELIIYHAIQKDVQHGSVIGYHGSLVHGTGHDRQCMIFLPLADCNLNTFLTQPGPYWGTNQRAITLLRSSADLCGGLKFLHQQLDDPNGLDISVIHGDLRPHNILVFFCAAMLLHEKKPLKITDYGFSKVKPRERGADDTSAAFKNGTFLSPEAASGKRVTINSDLWSLTAVLLEIITYIVGGPELVKKFRIFRTYKEGEVSYDRFFQGLGENARVNDQVTQWLDILRTCAMKKDAQFGAAIKHVLSTLEEKHLIVDEEERGKHQADSARKLFFEAASMLEQREPVGIHSVGREISTVDGPEIVELPIDEVEAKAEAPDPLERPSTTETTDSVFTTIMGPETAGTPETIDEMSIEHETAAERRLIKAEETTTLLEGGLKSANTKTESSPNDKPLPPTPHSDLLNEAPHLSFENLLPPANDSQTNRSSRDAGETNNSNITVSSRREKMEHSLKGSAKKFGGWLSRKLRRSTRP